MLLRPPIVAIGSAGGAAAVAVATVAAGRALVAVSPLAFVLSSRVERVVCVGGLDKAVSPLVPRHIPESMSQILRLESLANVYLAGKSFSMLVTKVKPPLTPESLLWWCFLPSCKGYKAIQFFVEL